MAVRVNERVLRPATVALAVATLAGGALTARAADGDGRFETQLLAAETYAETYQVAQAEEDGVNDPLETVNRGIFAVNEILYDILLRPATALYTGIVPPPLRNAISNIIDNLRTPVILANDLLQGEWDRAWVTTQRFVVNTTYGVGGILDQATGMGLEKHDEDFGQTLAVWGVDEPFYLVLPLLGPSNPRDAVGKFADGFLDPLGYYLNNIDADEAIWARMSTGAVDEYAGVREELDQIKTTSVDYYAAIRSMFRQKRAAEVRNGAEAEVELPPIPGLGLDEDLRGRDSQLAATELPTPATGADQMSRAPASPLPPQRPRPAPGMAANGTPGLGNGLPGLCARLTDRGRTPSKGSSLRVNPLRGQGNGRFPFPSSASSCILRSDRRS